MTDKAAGKAKEVIGTVTGDKEQQTEGKAQQKKAKAQEQAKKAQGKGKSVVDNVTGTVKGVLK